MASGDQALDQDDKSAADDTIAQTGPGIPDDAASQGYDPEADVEAERKMEAHLPSAEALFKRR